MIKFKSHLQEQDTLDEGIRQWLSKAKSAIASAFRGFMNKIKRLKAGQSVRIPVSLPKDISEAKERSKNEPID